MRRRICLAVMNRMERRPSKLLQYLQIRILMRTTAKAFGMPPRRLPVRRSEPILDTYVRYTVYCLRNSRAENSRVYSQAYSAGEAIRRLTGLREPEETARLIILLYRNIGITMAGSLDEGLQVTRCRFSSCYAPEDCARMSAMDSGIVGGLCGGGTLAFTRRLTHGDDCCLACYRKGNET